MYHIETFHQTLVNPWQQFVNAVKFCNFCGTKNTFIVNKKLQCIFGLLLLFYTANAQKNYKQGLVVLSNGDTVRGWIDYRNWKINPRVISFKKDSLSDDQKKYTTDDLISFQVTGFDVYRRAVVKKDMLPVEVASLSTLSDTTITDTVFLRTIVQGKVLSLYELYDFKAHYYIQDNVAEYMELVYKRYLVENNIDIITSNIYRNQLTKYAFDQHAGDKLMRKIERVEYNEHGLGPVVSALNKLAGDVSYVSDYNKKADVSFFAGAGAMYAGVKFSGQGLPGDMEFDSKVVPTFTAGVDVFALRNLKDLVLRFEVSYSAIKFSGTKLQPGVLVTKDTVGYVIKQNNITPSVSVLYNLIRKEKFRYYLGAQVGYNFSSYPTNHLTIYRYTGNYEVDNYIDFEKGWISIHAKTGAVINRRWEVGLTGLIGGAFVNYSGLSNRPAYYTLWVGYHFKK